MVKHDSYYEGERPEVLPFLPERFSRVLEIGCGDGGFRRLIEKDCEYWGVEREVAAAGKAGQYLDKVLAGSFDEIYDQLPDGYFDLVICNDVIEHFVDHERFLLDIRAKMAPDSFLVGSIPSVRYYKVLFSLLVMRDWRYTAKGVLDSTHLRFFTRKSLSRSFKANGFQAEELQGLNSAVYLKKNYCTSVIRTLAICFKFIVRFGVFLLVDILTLGHSSDIKYAQIGFRARLKN